MSVNYYFNLAYRVLIISINITLLDSQFHGLSVILGGGLKSTLFKSVIRRHSAITHRVFILTDNLSLLPQSAGS